MKGVELKKYEIDFRGMSRPIAIYANSDHSEIHWMDEKQHFSKE